MANGPLLNAGRNAITASDAWLMPSTPPAPTTAPSLPSWSTWAFHAGSACILMKPTAMPAYLEKFCLNLLKFHSNCKWISVWIC
jgi:hypothetical protein